MEKFDNPPEAEIRELLSRTHVIAVVGLSPKPQRPSHQVASRMQQFGYRIIPVRPAIHEVLNEKAYASLREVPDRIELVDVFRAPQHVDGIVDQCIELRLPALWLQDGVINPQAARRARDAGINVVMNRCVYRDYVNFFGMATHA